MFQILGRAARNLKCEEPTVLPTRTTQVFRRRPLEGERVFEVF